MMPQSSQLSVVSLIIIGVIAGSIPWIIRSLFDVVYVERRRRQTTALAIAADARALVSTARALRQRELLEAIAEERVSDISELRKLAFIRSSIISDPVQKFIPDVFLLKADDVFHIFDFYKKVFALRLIFEKLDEFVKSDVNSAFSLAKEAVILFDSAEQQAVALALALTSKYKGIFSA